MKQSIREELQAHVQDLINDGVLTDDNKDDWHFHAFNEDYYIIGYYNCEQWLKKHDVSVLEAVNTIREYEQANFGEVTTDLSYSEGVVNMYVYILGEEIIADMED